MQDPTKKVQKKAAAFRVVGKYYPEEIYEFLVKWAKKGYNNTKWIIKNSLKFLNEGKRKKISGLWNNRM